MDSGDASPADFQRARSITTTTDRHDK